MTRLNGNVQGVLTRGDDAIAAMHAWRSRTGATRAKLAD